MSTLVLVPTQLTFSRLKTMMSASPVNLEWDTMHIALAENLSSHTDVKDMVYTASFDAFGFEYSESAGHSILVGTLQSPTMQSRRGELGKSMEDPIHLIFAMDSAPGFTNRSWIASLSTVLYQHEGLFTFGPEKLLG
jgi:hypothetical protein